MKKIELFFLIIGIISIFVFLSDSIIKNIEKRIETHLICTAVESCRYGYYAAQHNISEERAVGFIVTTLKKEKGHVK